MFTKTSRPAMNPTFSVRNRVTPMNENQPSVSSRITPHTPNTASRKPDTSRNFFMGRSWTRPPVGRVRLRSTRPLPK